MAELTPIPAEHRKVYYDALLAGRDEARRRGYHLLDDRIFIEFHRALYRPMVELIVADTRRKVAEEQGETFEEWRVTGQPGDGHPAYDFTWTPDRTGPDPERDARSFIRLHDAAGVPWNDRPHLSRRVVTRTAWQAIERGSGNGGTA